MNDERYHFVVAGLYDDGSNAYHVGRGEWARPEPFHSFRDATLYRDGLVDGNHYDTVLICAVPCACEEAA